MLSHYAKKVYKKTLFSRHDDDGSAFYFSAADFEGLKKEPYPVINQKGHRLSGFLYYYDGYKEESLVIFEHGMGVGHRAYIREIERIAREGYLVFAYDKTGCTESEGEHIRGFSGSLADLDAVLTTIKADKRFSEKKISVIGHSWGAFSTMNISAFHSDLHALVAISGFVSVKTIQKQVVPKIGLLIIPSLYKLERNENPQYFDKTAFESLPLAKGKVLIIHSRDDGMVSFKKNFEALREALSYKENISFIELDGKNHNPNYTDDAVKYKNSFSKTLAKQKKAKKLSTPEQRREFILKYDFYRMTEQDEAVWQKIFETIA